MCINSASYPHSSPRRSHLIDRAQGLAEDCFLGARLLLNDRAGQTRTTDPKRIELAKQVLSRALKLAPENEAYRKLAGEL